MTGKQQRAFAVFFPAAIVIITLLAFGLRVYAVGWGLPYTDNPDEPSVMNIALGMLRAGDFNPRFFIYPSFYLYLLLAVITVHYRWGLATHLYQPLDQMEIYTHFYTTIPGFFVWGRVLTALLGSLTVVAAYRLGRENWSSGAGLFAALWIATSPYHMRHSQFVTTDVPGGFFVILAFLFATRIVGGGWWRDYLVGGVCAGLAAATKYNAGMIVLSIIVAHLLCWGRQAVRQGTRLIGAGVVSLVAFAATSPYILLDWPQLLRTLRAHAIHYATGAHGDYQGAWNLSAYLEFFWMDGLRPEACIALLIGLAVLGRERPRLALVWLAFAMPYTLLFMSYSTHFMRNLIPALMVTALPIGVGGAAIVRAILRRRLPGRRLIVAVVILAFFLVPTRDAVIFARFEAMPDSKILAAQFVRTLPRGRLIAVELNPVQWSGDPIVETVNPVTQYPVEWYQEHGFRYLVLNADIRGSEDWQAYQRIQANAKMIQAFPGNRGGKPGPRIEVYDLGPRLEGVRLTLAQAQFGDSLKLLGYQAAPGPLRPALTSLEGRDDRDLGPNEGLQLNLFWQSMRKMANDYTLFVHVLDPNGQVVAQRDTVMRAEDYPTSRWQPDEIVIDRADLVLPALPPGTYTIRLGLYRMETLERLPLVKPGADPGLTTLDLTTITINE